jgi:glutamine phosphoribosylpyrophosphate amidotransferase
MACLAGVAARGSCVRARRVKRIRNAVDSQLQAKGHALTADTADFLIAMQLSGKTAYGGSTGGKSKLIEKKEGTLVLDFLDAKTKSLVWRGTASGAVRPATSPEEQQQRINEVIAELLTRFPLKK